MYRYQIIEIDNRFIVVDSFSVSVRNKRIGTNWSNIDSLNVGCYSNKSEYDLKYKVIGHELSKNKTPV